MQKGQNVRRWQPDDIALLNEKFGLLSDEEIGNLLCRSPEAVQTKRMELSLIKDKSFSDLRSKKTQFKKGHVSVIVPHHLKAKRADAWTDEEVAFLKANWETMTSKEVAAAIGRTRSGTTSKALELGVKKSNEATKALRQRLIGKIIRKDGWKPNQLEYLKANWAHYSAIEIAAVIGRTAASVKTRANDLGLKTTKEALSRICAKPNAGQKQSLGPIGTITTRTNSKGVKTVWVKTGDKQWLQLCRYNWINAGKEIPEDCAFYFVDGDRTNCAIENLELRPLGRRARATGAADRKARRLEEKAQKRKAREERKALKLLWQQNKATGRLVVAARRIEKEREAAAARKAQRMAEREQRKALKKFEADQLQAERLLLKDQADRQRANLSKRINADGLTPEVKSERHKKLEKEVKQLRIRTALTGKPERKRKDRSVDAKLARQQEREALRINKEAEKAAEAKRNKAIKEQQVRMAKAAKERQRLVEEEESKKKFKTRPIDLSEMISLRIDAKTTVFIRPDQDPEAVRQKYLRNKPADKYEGLPPVYQF